MQGERGRLQRELQAAQADEAEAQQRALQLEQDLQAAKDDVRCCLPRTAP